MIFSSRKNIAKIQLVFFATVLVLLCSLVLALPRISIPISLAYILALSLNPFVDSLMRFNLTKTMATVLVFIVLIFGIGIPLVNVIPNLSLEAQELQYSIPQIERYLIAQFDYVREFIRAKTGHEIAEGYIFQALSQIESWTGEFVVKLPNYLATLFEWLFLVPFFTFFIIRDSDSF